MNSQEYRNLQEAYLDVYQEEVLDEVRGGGEIDPVSDIPGIGLRGARSPRDAGLQMSPLDRAKLRANALEKRNDPKAKKRASDMNKNFIRPTEKAVNRSLLAATNARHAEKTRLQALNNSYDLFDVILEYLITEGYADTNENALVIMANMSEEWRESIVEVTGRGRIDPIGDASVYGAGVGERNSRTPKDAGLRMSPVDRATARANALKKRNDPEATKRANRINSRFVNPTNRTLDRSMLAANNQKQATAKRLRQQQQDQA